MYNFIFPLGLSTLLISRASVPADVLRAAPAVLGGAAVAEEDVQIVLVFRQTVPPPACNRVLTAVHITFRTSQTLDLASTR